MAGPNWLPPPPSYHPLTEDWCEIATLEVAVYRPVSESSGSPPPFASLLYPILYIHTSPFLPLLFWIGSASIELTLAIARLVQLISMSCSLLTIN